MDVPAGRRVTAGRYGPPGIVLMANAEDAPGQVVVPRLTAAGADLDRVEFFTMRDALGSARSPCPTTSRGSRCTSSGSARGSS